MEIETGSWRSFENKYTHAKLKVDLNECIIY